MTHWTSLYGHRDENTLVDVQSRMRRMMRATLFPGFSRLGQKLLSWRSSYASVSEDAAKQMRSAARNGSKDVGNLGIILRICFELFREASGETFVRHPTDRVLNLRLHASPVGSGYALNSLVR